MNGNESTRDALFAEFKHGRLARTCLLGLLFASKGLPDPGLGSFGIAKDGGVHMAPVGTLGKAPARRARRAAKRAKAGSSG